MALNAEMQKNVLIDTGVDLHLLVEEAVLRMHN